MRVENTESCVLQSQRRPPPAAPVNLEKVINGELKGEELYKFNGEVLQEWNDSALVPCQNCQRTFLPSSLVSHQRSCTQTNPMVKPSKEQSYTARANAKVSGILTSLVTMLTLDIGLSSGELPQAED